MSDRMLAGGKIASTKIPRVELIPTEAINRLASICELGLERKKEKAWNALTRNQEILQDKEMMFDRIGHVIAHAMKLRDKLMKDDFTIDEDDDAAAIMWGGMYLCCATKKEGETTCRNRVIRLEEKK